MSEASRNKQKKTVSFLISIVEWENFFGFFFFFFFPFFGKSSRWYHFEPGFILEKLKQKFHF